MQGVHPVQHVRIVQLGVQGRGGEGEGRGGEGRGGEGRGRGGEGRGGEGRGREERGGKWREVEGRGSIMQLGVLKIICKTKIGYFEHTPVQ